MLVLALRITDDLRLGLYQQKLGSNKNANDVFVVNEVKNINGHGVDMGT